MLSEKVNSVGVPLGVTTPFDKAINISQDFTQTFTTTFKCTKDGKTHVYCSWTWGFTIKKGAKDVIGITELKPAWK
jgi:hypothetical protein